MDPVPVLAPNSKTLRTLRRVRWLPVFIVVLVLAAIVLVLFRSDLWITSLVMIAGAWVLAYVGRESL